MPTVEFKLGNRKYEIACDEGEQQNINELAESLNVRVLALSKTFNNASDSMVLAITALMMEEEIKNNQSHNAPTTQQIQSNSQDEIDLAIIDAIEPITQYIEKLASKLEKG